MKISVSVRKIEKRGIILGNSVRQKSYALLAQVKHTQDQVDNGEYPFYIRSDVPVRSNRYLYDCEAVITIGDGNIGKGISLCER